MRHSSHSGSRSSGSARVSLDLARTIIDDRRRDADAARAVEARPGRRQAHAPITQRRIVGPESIDRNGGRPWR